MSISYIGPSHNRASIVCLLEASAFRGVFLSLHILSPGVAVVNNHTIGFELEMLSIVT